MRKTISIKADLSPAFLNLMSSVAPLFNDYIDWAFLNKSYNKSKAHKELYNLLTEKYPMIPTGIIQTIRDNALESIKSLVSKHKSWNFTLPRKSKYSSVRFDRRTSSIRGNLLTLSSLGKRQKFLLDIPEYFKEIFKIGKFQGLTLCLENNQFCVKLVFKLPDPTPSEDKIVLGIDRGIISPAVCSDGTAFSGKLFNKIKRKRNFLRRKLRAKGTRSAKRHLKKMSRREMRFSLNQNHIISKHIANLPFGIFALEDLSFLFVNKGKSMNRRSSNWSYSQLELLLRYKAEELGKMVVLVDARYTSQKCSCCGTINKKNRKGQKFLCLECGFADNADLNAAKNIRDLAIAGKIVVKKKLKPFSWKKKVVVVGQTCLPEQNPFGAGSSQSANSSEIQGLSLESALNKLTGSSRE